MRTKSDTSGNVAIYDETINGDAPLTAPLSNLAALRFHSGLDYPKLVKVAGSFVTTGSLNGGTDLPAVSADTISQVNYPLFAHGQTGTPMVFGKLTLSGSDIPLVGSVPIVVNPTIGVGADGFGRWAHLGADTTNVLLRVVSIAPHTAALAALSGVTYTIYVTNLRLDGAQPAATDSKLLRINADRMSASNGKFDSQNRLMRKANSGKQFAMTQGKTVDVIGSSALNFRFSVDGWIKQYGASPGSFNATTTDAKFY